MYKKTIQNLFSMRMMALGMLIFLVAIALATILESKHDIQTAKLFIYNAKWFEILLVYLLINLIVNIFRYRMFSREKVAMLSFHLSFIVIIIGAAVTRYFSFEGLMLIREGSSSNFIYLSDPHLWFKINDGKMQYTLNQKLLQSEQWLNSFDHDVNFPNRKKPLRIEVISFRKKMIDTLIINDSINESVLEIVTDGMKSNYVGPNQFVMVGENALSFEKKNSMPGIDVKRVNGQLFVASKLPFRYLPMSKMKMYRQSGATPPDEAFTSIPSDSLVPFYSTTLYQVAGQQFVFKRIIEHAKMMKVSSGRKDKGLDVLSLKISDDVSSKNVDLVGGIGQIPEKEIFQFSGLTFEMEYGSSKLNIPFSIACRDFKLDRYPGSNVASSFESEVTILDPEKKYTRNQRIFMNHVMDYRGYRFFQSSYDPDEKGTRLSVNHDFWGTNITYLGYLLMAIGMIMSLFAPNGRFKDLLSKINISQKRRKELLSFLIILSTSFFGFSQGDHHDHNHNHAHQKKEIAKKEVSIHRIVSEEHSEDLASLLVQDYDGRIVPLHTMADQLLRKIYGKSIFEKKNAIQVIMSMHMYPPFWMGKKIISIPQVLREPLHLSNYEAYTSLVNLESGEFKWLSNYNSAHQKLESKRSEFDKKIIKLVERFQVLSAIFSWEYMKIIPLKGDKNNTWFVPLNMELMKKDSISSSLALRYLAEVDEAAKNNSFVKAKQSLTKLKSFQRTIAKGIVPSSKHVDLEIRYNKMNVFKNTMYSYFTLGIVLLILYFVRIFVKPTHKSERIIKQTMLPFIILIGIVFVYHGIGIGLRWYISGHAPWSNGYEAVVFIAWVAMLAGFIFSRKNGAVLAGTAILSFFILFVTELNLMDPEITPLQPVLKSYWLMIHVAIITGSYGFLGLGAILSLLNQVLYLFRSKKNGLRITVQIKEITAVSELTITLGLFMLTIGTFLGGIWANESWGRYWGWDPKETWALVSVLVYAIILHLRYIPGLNSTFTFNLVSFWGYGAIIFTFFGVNFYLVGLHSYAQGEGLAEIPNWIFYTIAVFFLFSCGSYLRYRTYKLKQSRA